METKVPWKAAFGLPNRKAPTYAVLPYIWIRFNNKVKFGVYTKGMGAVSIGITDLDELIELQKLMFIIYFLTEYNN